jgi:tRNA modification GTPase
VTAEFADTIVAIATPAGRGALALVRVSGREAFEVVARCVRPWPLEPRRATLVTVRAPETAAVAERAVAIAMPGPGSFTGDDTVELTPHGGAVAPARVVAALLQAGARLALPGEFTRRAVLAGKLDLLQAEAIGDLVDAPSVAVHRAALEQLSGTLTRRIASLRESLLALEALLAYDVDFPGEDDGPVAPARIAQAAQAVMDELERLLGTLPAARLAREGAVVVFAGVPNAGKSSLFNALLGESRAIVTEHPGTTRDAVDALVEAEPYPLRLVDTAGLRATSDPVERIGVEVSGRWLARADIILACGTTAADRAAAVEAAAGSGGTLIEVRTMSDLATRRDERAQSARASSERGSEAGMVEVSALTGEGLDELRAAIVASLARRHPLPSGDTPMILRARHAQALATARAELTAFLAAWAAGSLPATVAAVHVRAATSALDDLVGAVDADDVLARVFAQFCVGK